MAPRLHFPPVGLVMFGVGLAAFPTYPQLWIWLWTKRGIVRRKGW